MIILPLTLSRKFCAMLLYICFARRVNIQNTLLTILFVRNRLKMNVFSNFRGFPTTHAYRNVKSIFPRPRASDSILFQLFSCRTSAATTYIYIITIMLLCTCASSGRAREERTYVHTHVRTYNRNRSLCGNDNRVSACVGTHYYDDVYVSCVCVCVCIERNTSYKQWSG